MQPAALLPIVNAAAWAFAMLLIRVLRHTEHPNTIVFYLGFYMTPMSLIPALFFWETPGMAALFSVFLVAVAATGAHICMTRALGIAEASHVVSFDFCRLPFAAALGLVFFGELMDLWSWVGAGVISASTLYIGHREPALARITKH
jgi:drug/metabolite transporter (DMT)-like permease